MAARAVPLILLVVLLFSGVVRGNAAGSCSSVSLPSNRVYSSCSYLPHLSSSLHWTYEGGRGFGSLSFAFVAPPQDPSGWVSWAINPSGSGMIGCQALIAFRQPDGAMGVKTYNITGYGPVAEGPIEYETSDLAAEFADGATRMFGKVKLPEGTTVVKQVWQVGAEVVDGVPQKHDFKPENLQAMGTVDIVGGGISAAGSSTSRSKNAYVAAFPCEGGVSLLQKMRTVVVVLVLLIILGMVLGSYVLLHLLHRSRLQEGLLQAKLIKLKGAIQQAERKSMNKSLAFASASHDIRTSLAGITGLVGICLADAPRVSELHSNMQQINTCVTKLLGILNSVLDTSKIEAGKMQPEEVEFDICQVLEESTDIFHIVGLNKGLEVIWDPCDYSIFTSTIVRGDCQRLKQIIDNLLSNAIKFTSEGHVLLRAWARKPSFKKIEVSSRKGFDLRNVLNPLLGWLSNGSSSHNYVGNPIESYPDHIEIIIEVDDTGVGIPKEKRASVFENYVQVKESLNGGHEGTGLGLGIVQSFVRLMGGEIKIMDKTPTEKGTCFRFNILLKSCKQSDTNVDDESRAERSSSLPINSNIIKDSANSQIMQSTISSMEFKRGLARDSIHAILFVQGDETTRIMQRWMEISGVEVWVIDHWRLIYSITDKIKNSLGRLGRSKSKSLASLLNTTVESLHAKDEANKILPLSNLEFKTSTKDYTIWVLIVIDFSLGSFPEIELTLKRLINGNESLHFKIVWLVNSNAPTDGLRRSKHVPCHLILQKPIHGSRLYALSRLIQDFGRESEHDLLKMPRSFESNNFSSNSSSFQYSSHEVFSSSLNLEHKPLNGMNIFLVEDVSTLRRVATKLISCLGASVTSCEDGLNALDLIRDALRKLDSMHEGNASNDSKRFPYDAILMDCEMPFMNGYEATRLIREEERNYGLRIPIIALTAHASPEEARKTALAGMDFHLTKPLQANQLLHAINTVIKESI